MPVLDFNEAMAFLENRTRFGINLGLERIEKLLANLGDPHQKNVKYIHIGGTNGKGSTAAFLASVLQAAGYKVGVFTSPHLHSYCERMVINGEQISKADVTSLINRMIPVLDKVEAEGVEPPTEFEVNTAMALQYFTEQQVDYAIMEVGMGGAIDSTNVIVPKVSVITNVAMDHMAYLGSSVAEIAKVKVGIIKQGVPIITGAKDNEALQVIKEYAAKQNARLWRLGGEINWCNRRLIEGRQLFDICVADEKQKDLAIKMLGEHQLDNATLAVAAAVILGINKKAIATGLLNTEWPGRLEVISEKPMLVLDGAHNEHGMVALAKALAEYWPKQKKIAVIGMLADKEREKAMSLLLPLIDYAVITKVPNLRAGDWQKIGEICHNAAVPCEEAEEVACACAKALERLALGKEDMILTTGSLYMLAEAREWWLNYQNKLVLASGSPRRRELLSEKGVNFEVLAVDAAEIMHGKPKEAVVENALIKAKAASLLRPCRYVLGADTVVAIGGEILGKPKDEADAMAMLGKLSDNWHSVFTGIALIKPDGTCITRCVESRVKFKVLSKKDIAAYVATGEPLDKAGAYGIQGLGGVLVEKVEGDYTNIVGLPTEKVMDMLVLAGFKNKKSFN